MRVEVRAVEQGLADELPREGQPLGPAVRLAHRRVVLHRVRQVRAAVRRPEEAELRREDLRRREAEDLAADAARVQTLLARDGEEEGPAPLRVRQLAQLRVAVREQAVAPHRGHDAPPLPGAPQRLELGPQRGDAPLQGPGPGRLERRAVVVADGRDREALARVDELQSFAVEAPHEAARAGPRHRAGPGAVRVVVPGEAPPEARRRRLARLERLPPPPPPPPRCCARDPVGSLASIPQLS
mmetsp:Transcript_16294/g.53178  ORF Transcript_16294/g.53178 Transcript_16294/m.53178 type:complete len:241 (+) Transcript_16294:484-1206(+)